MMSSPSSADLSPLVSRNAANSAFREAVRLFVGRGRRFSCKEVEIGTGIKSRMIESFMAPVESTDFRKPDLEEVLTLSSFFGAAFTSQWLKLAQQAAFDLPDGSELPPGEVAADNAADNAEIASAARDGRFDEVERQRLHPVGQRMMTRGLALVALSA